MKGLLFLTVLAFIPGIALAAEQPVSALSDEGHTRYISSPYQSSFSYRSPRIPLWSFGLRYDKELPYHPLWIDAIDSYRQVDSVRISASRALPYVSSMRVFAAIQTSNQQDYVSAREVYLPQNAGIAASLGWTLGNTEQFNMAVEYEHREIGELDVNSLVLGVQYYF